MPILSRMDIYSNGCTDEVNFPERTIFPKKILLKALNNVEVSHSMKVKTLILTRDLKRKAVKHPDQQLSQILRSELAGVSEGPLSQLSPHEAINKTMKRQRHENLLPNPRILDELEDVSPTGTKILQGEKFLLHDSCTFAEEKNKDDENSDPEIPLKEEDRPFSLLFNNKSIYEKTPPQEFN